MGTSSRYLGHVCLSRSWVKLTEAKMEYRYASIIEYAHLWTVCLRLIGKLVTFELMEITDAGIVKLYKVTKKMQ